MRLLFCLLYIPAMGILAHMIGEALPRKWFNPEAWPFKPFKFERGGRIYEKLGVKSRAAATNLAAEAMRAEQFPMQFVF